MRNNIHTPSSPQNRLRALNINTLLSRKPRAPNTRTQPSRKPRALNTPAQSSRKKRVLNIHTLPSNKLRALNTPQPFSNTKPAPNKFLRRPCNPQQMLRLSQTTNNLPA